MGKPSHTHAMSHPYSTNTALKKHSRYVQIDRAVEEALLHKEICKVL